MLVSKTFMRTVTGNTQCLKEKCLTLFVDWTGRTCYDY